MSTDATSRLATLSVEERNALAQRLFNRRGQSASAPQAIPRRPAAPDDALPLSFAQQRFWFLNQLAPQNAAYTVAEANRLRGPLDVAALKRAFTVVVARHQVLRTVFQTLDGRPVQRISSVPIVMEDEDLSGEPDVRAALDRRWSELWGMPWDLEKGPLVRARVLRLGEEDHVVVILVHHIISDGWSKAVLVRELAEVYRAFSRGATHSLPALPVQYADYAAWQQDWIGGDEAQRQLEFLTRHLAELPILQLPLDQPGRSGAVGTHHTVVFSEELSQAARSFSQREGVTLFMTLLATFATLLARYSSQPEVVVGTPTANRTRGEVEHLIGCFMNPLPIRVDGRGNPTFRELLARVRQASLGVFANQEVPFDVLVRTLQPQRDAATPPLFQAMLLFHNLWKSIELTSGELTSTEFTVNDSSLQKLNGVKGPGDLVYPIALEVTDLGSRLLACFEYANEYATVLSGMPAHFQTLLGALVADPELRVLDAPILSRAERLKLVEEWNPASRGMASASVHDLFEQQVARRPDAVAVGTGVEQVTYAELNARANRLAAFLRASGVGPEVTVGVLLDRSVEMITTLLAVLKAGGAYVPMDPAYPADRLAFMAADSGMPLLITTRPILSERDTLVRSLREGGVVCLDELAGALAHYQAENVRSSISPTTLAYVIYTSGSTGTPKGVQVPHGAIANYTQVAADTFGLDPRDRVLQFASISFDTAAEEIFPALARGATLVLRTEAMVASVRAFLQLCREWRITVLDFPTAYWHEIGREMADEGLDLPEDVRLIILGGEKAQMDRVREWQARFGCRARLLNSYGPTEATVVATYFDVPADAGRLPRTEIPIGRPIPNATAYVLDCMLRPVPVGVPGELYIGGAGVARGYLNQPGLTAERFVPDPFSADPGARLYRSGDQARYLADGEIEFLGRVDDQVKLRGFRIEPGEIESVLTADESIDAAVVVVREDRPGDRRLVGYVVPVPGAAPTPADVRRRAKTLLPEHMVPSAIVVLERLPLTPNGKIDRRSLPAPDGTRQAFDEFVPPRTDAERRVAEIWCEVLSLSQAGAMDNFFDLGGHSMLAMKVVSRLGRAFDVDVPVRIMFETKTLADQAARVELMKLLASGADARPAEAVGDEVVL